MAQAAACLRGYGVNGVLDPIHDLRASFTNKLDALERGLGELGESALSVFDDRADDALVRSVVLHAHCYQPPREDPWLELVDVEPSASPDHDWNERIDRECYARLAATEVRVAPARVDEPPAMPPEQRDAMLRAEGIDPAYLEHAPSLRAKLLGAAVAMHGGDGAAAIVLQRDAVSLCAKLELFEMQVISQTALATYLSGLGERAAAKREIQAAIELARARSLPRSESQALLALGLLHNLDREPDAAMRAYADSARAAELANEPSLAIEAWRTAGQLALGHREDAIAADCFGQAIRLAETSPAQVVQSSGAAEAARALAAVYERRAMPEQAASLYAQADAMEAGEVGTAPPVEPAPVEPTASEESDHARQ
jgi:tetratricopeptide (TPR) repeat protein